MKRVCCICGSRIICTSFSEKGELELLTNATYADYDVFINDIWEPLVAADLRYSTTPSNASNGFPLNSIPMATHSNQFQIGIFNQ